MVNFATLTPPNSPNYYLVCPKGYCKVKPHKISPVYPFAVSQLYEKWQQMIKQQPRVELVYKNKENWQYTYVQRSWLFQFKDYITVSFIRMNAKQSTLAIYSHSKTGYYDFGVNRRRVNAWLAALKNT